MNQSCTGSAARSGGGSGERQAHGENNTNPSERREIQRISKLRISKGASVRKNVVADPNSYRPIDEDNVEEGQDKTGTNGNGFSQRHPSNWVEADEDDDADESELCVQSTPPYY